MTGAILKARLAFPFLVVRKGRSMLPRFRHATIDEATAEAERRVAQDGGETYLVLQEVLRVKSSGTASPLRGAEPGDMAPPSPGSSGDSR